MTQQMTTHRSRARLLTPALIGLLMGAALQLQQSELSPLGLYGVVLALALLGLLGLKFSSPQFRTVLVLLALTALAWALTGIRASAFDAKSLAPELQGRDINVVGVVSAMPQRNATGLRFRFQIESATLAGSKVLLPPSLYLGWYGVGFFGALHEGDEPQRLSELRAGERWQLTLRLKAPHGGSNPHGFDFELWLWEQGLQATGYVRSGAKDPQPLRLESTWQYPVEQLRQSVRDSIFKRLTGSAFPPERSEQTRLAGIVAALVVGDQRVIDRADWDLFRATGVAHLMAISGLHVTLFAWVAALLIGWSWRRSSRLCLAVPAPNAALFGGLALATAYAVFSGWGVPSQRTIWMLLALGLLQWSGKRWSWPRVWLLAAAVVVLIDPWALLQAGFWLSFVAVGILFAGAAGSEVQAVTGIRPRVRTMWREQWTITLALTPLTLLLFGQVSLVGLLANLVAIPWVTLVVTPLALLGVALAPLWDVSAWAVQALAALLQWLSAWPFATVSVAQPPWWAGVAGVFGGALLVFRLPWSLRLLGLPLLLPVLLWQAQRPLEGQFELLAADIGQGNAVLVQTAKHALVFDAGPRFSSESDAGHRVLVPLLRALAVRLDTLVLSHRDSDHTGGAPAVLAMQPGAELLSSIEEDHELHLLRRGRRCEAGQSWVWDGVRFDVLHPLASDYDIQNKSNSLSCVLRISNGAQTALLTGDIEAAQEARLVADAAPLRADVLLVPHHGSKTSSSAAFLDAVQPRFALIQAGYRNRYGHPAEPVLLRYAQRHIRVFDSPRCGAATWQSARPKDVKCQRTQGLRYWHHRLP